MSKKWLNLTILGLIKKEFHKSKQPTDLMSVNVDQTVISDRFKHSDEGFKYFIGHQEDEIVKPLCIILPQMSGYIKYFENGVKNMYFFVGGDNVLDKYKKIWNVIKNKLSIKFQSMPVYNETYIKVKVRKFDSKIKTNFLGNEVGKENMHYTCIACITIDSLMKKDEKNYPQVYLEECKYRMKKIQMTRLINAKPKSDSESDSGAESKSDTKLMAKLKSGSDSNSE